MSDVTQEGYEACRYCGSKEHTSSNHQFDTGRITSPIRGAFNRLRGR